MFVKRTSKRALSLLLVLTMLMGLVPWSLVSFGATGDPTIVIAGSDYQNTNGGLFSSATSTSAYKIMSQIKEDYSEADGFLFGGDYYAHSTNTTTESTNGKNQLKNEIVDVLYPNMADDAQIYIQGNHDADSLTTNGTLATSGAHDSDDYGVFVINEKDYMWYNDDQSTIKNTAASLKAYLDEKTNGYNKPIFVLSHLPLHYSNRTIKEGDGKYAKYIYDVLDEAGNNGLNIVFMYGHNHSTSYYEEYLGNGAVYLPEGDTIYVANEGSQTSCFSDTLSFTYMNYGFTGYLTGTAADGALTMTVFVIYDDEVKVKRYDENGLHNLKSAGTNGATPAGATVNTNLIGTDGATISPLTTPAVSATYEKNGVSVTAPGLTGINVVKNFGTSDTAKYDGKVYAAYASYDITATGFVNGSYDATVKITLDAVDGFDSAKKVVVIDKTYNRALEASVLDGKVTFTTDHFSTYDIVQYKSVEVQVPGDATGEEGDSSNIWRQVTTMTPGKQYMLVNYGYNVSSAYATYAIGTNGHTPGAAVSVLSDEKGAYIENEDLAIAWEAVESSRDGCVNLKNMSSGGYLTASSSTGEQDLTVGTSVSGYAYWNVNLVNSGTESEPSIVAYQLSGNGYRFVRHSNGEGGFVTYDSNSSSGKNDNWIALFERGSGTTTEYPTVDTNGGGWVTITKPTGGTTTYTYTQATTITAGEKYVIVGNDDAVALMDNDGSMGTQTVTISGTTMTSTVELTEWTFSGSGSGTIFNGTRYLRYDRGFSLSGDATTLTFADNGDNFSIYYNYGNYYSVCFYYSGNRWTSTYGSEENVRLYKLTDTTTIGGTNGLYGRIVDVDGDEDFAANVAYGASEDAALAAIKAEIDIYYATQSDYSDETKFADDGEGMTWEIVGYDANTPGEYAVNISYNGTLLGTAKVIVPDASNMQTVYVSIDSSKGAVTTKATEYTKTGSTITITNEAGEVLETVDVTVGMLRDANGNPVTISGATTYTDLKVYYTYKGQEVMVLDGYTLTVSEKVVNNYPNYPDEGAVKVNKTATGLDFQASGVAQVELSVSGVPSKKGVDVIVMVDTSSSMKRGENTGNDNAPEGEQRIDFLQTAVASLIKEFQTPGDDGEILDIRVAIAEFNGYKDSNGNYAISGNNCPDDTAQQGATNSAEVFTGDKSKGAGAFVAATSITDPDTFASQIGAHSGTNYDYAFDTVYRLGSAITKANETERDLFVIFMSDGAPYQYNYYGSGTTNRWNDYLMGTMSESYLNDNSHFYNKNGDHWMAEAIKGTGKFPVIDPTGTLGEDASADYGSYFRYVDGLGAQLHTIGFCLYDDDVGGDGVDVVYEETQQAVMQNLASVDEYGNAMYHETKSGADLNEIFCDIAEQINYAATNAYFLDQMGSSFDIQLVPQNYLPERVTDYANSKTITPTIEVRSYDIYTVEDFNTGVITDESLIGARKGTYSVIETVTFTYTATTVTDKAAVDYGRTVYTLTGAYSTQIDVDKDGTVGATNPVTADDGTVTYTIDTGDNILGTDGVIYAKNFAYNTTSAPVVVNGITVAAESFYWYIGTVTTTEMAINYYVYLSGSMEGEKEAGSYATNNYATLYYENYLGNDAYKDTTSPSVAWKSALVNYAFYLVDGNGNPVNMDGDSVTFANKVAVTQPVTYREILLNNLDNVNSIDVASLGTLPTGYTLYDPSAKYTVTIKSNSTGKWEIVQGEGKAATTYVTDFSNTVQYSNVLTTEDEAYDYTHTTVWFAVVWTPQCIPDAVVIDYGLPVKIKVMSNDMFGALGTIEGITTGTVTGKPTGESTTNVTAQKVTGDYGTAEIVTSNATGDLDAHNLYVLYTPNTMSMDGVDTFTYSVYYDSDTNPGYYYGSVTVIPATTIYYEESFVALNNSTAASDSFGKWTDAGKADTSATQAEDRPGKYNLSYIDANNIYGYDKAYNACTTYSNGGAKVVTVDAATGKNGVAPTATFKFTGTGFDVISLTDSKSGLIITSVYSVNADGTVGSKVASKTVNNYYNYSYGEYVNEDGETVTGWYVSDSDKNSTETIWQVPVIKIEGLDYAEYYVEIKVAYIKSMDVAAAGSYSFWLDAIRVYDPAEENTVVYENGEGTDDDVTIGDIYAEDVENNPDYVVLKDIILDSANLTTDGAINGAVFIDGKDSTSNATDYANPGPNNETYLAKEQSVSFKLVASAKPEAVMIGAKLAFGSSAKLMIGTEEFVTVATATDMYYDLSGKLVWTLNSTSGKYETQVITLSNATDGAVISLTNLKAINAEFQLASAATVLSLEEEVVSVTPMVDEEVLTTAAFTLRALYAPAPVVEYFEPDYVEASWRAGREKKASVLTVFTSDDVESISVGGQVITKYVRVPKITFVRGKMNVEYYRAWVLTLKINNAGTYVYDVVAYNAEGLASETIETELTVKANKR